MQPSKASIIATRNKGTQEGRRILPQAEATVAVATVAATGEEQEGSGGRAEQETGKQGRSTERKKATVMQAIPIVAKKQQDERKQQGRSRRWQTRIQQEKNRSRQRKNQTANTGVPKEGQCLKRAIKGSAASA